MTTLMLTNIRMIPLSAIDAPAWNSRVDVPSKEETKAIERMAEEFNDPRIGQLQPIEVEDKGNGRYTRIIGSRRVKAAIKAGLTEIRADVRPMTDEVTQARRNTLENMQRADLSTYEVARACAHFRTLGLKNEEIAPMVNLKSGSAVSNWCTVYANLPPQVLKAWAAGNAAATQDNLSTVARDHKSDDDKLQAWDEIEAERAKEDRAPGKRGKAKPKGESNTTAGYSVSQKRLERLILALSSRKATPSLTDETRKWGKSILDFVTNQRNAVAGVCDLDAEAAADKADKAAIKEQQAAEKLAAKAEKLPANGKAATA